MIIIYILSKGPLFHNAGSFLLHKELVSSAYIKNKNIIFGDLKDIIIFIFI